MKYLDCIFSNNFLPMISRATHFGGNNGTCIDHILTNDLSRVIMSGIIRCNISRHLPTFLKLDMDIKSESINRKPKVKINEFLLNGFTADLDKLNFDYNGESAIDIYTRFHENFKSLYDKWFLNPISNNPYKSPKPSYLRSDWISISIAKSSDVKNRLYDNWVKYKTSDNWNKYINYKRVFEDIKNKEKFRYYDRCFKANQHDLKKTWSLINGILGRKKSNKLLSFPSADAAHNFNTYFVNIAKDLISNNYGDEISSTNFGKYMFERQSSELKDCNFESKDVESIIMKLNNSKGTYYSPRVLKLLSSSICPVLANIFNCCVRDGYFPNELKIAKVIPLFKNKGSITDISNYRPISMLSVFSKVFEKLIHKEVSQFFISNNIFNNCQYGFREKHSTVHALINAISNVHDSIDNKQHTLGIFIDYSKAFDTINHEILLHKLDNYGIRGNMLKLIQSYLSDRYQYVSYGGLDSALISITIGVPQGSVLGPLLFIIFINDIVNVSDLAKFVLFADDLNLFLSHSDRTLLYQQANAILMQIYNYCFDNMLIINFDKCCFIDFSREQLRGDSYLGILNHRFEQVEKCKFLGVYINGNLKWDDQITNVISQVSKSCGSLYSIRLHVPTKILRQVYLSLIQPYLTYCIPLWGANFHSASMQKLFVLQKKCIRIVSGKTIKINAMFQHTKPLFFRLKLLTISNLYIYFCGCMSMRILSQETPRNIFSLFNVSERSYRLIYPKFHSSKIKDSSFIFNASKILNYLYDHGIPYFILTASTFKVRLKKYLLNIQNISLKGDDNWLPCNHDIFSNITC